MNRKDLTMTNKTSIRNIDPDMLWDAKVYAAQTRQTMGEVVTEALCMLIQENVDEEAEQPAIVPLVG